ncbi:hypothetical protein PR048_023235 [Dryococelus australis]|uniref:Uncharacterized protein n=1 Tax=Dryococelus australis TaxID=614101 RepID=A0ABQ9GTK4_9NEOP|nr:hypothetical protein PR048_023235 [Dryococelus australis]
MSRCLWPRPERSVASRRFVGWRPSATVAERLARSPPTKAIQVQSPAGSYSHVGNVPDDAVDRRVFSGDLQFPPPFHLGAATSSPRSPSSALKTSMLRAAQILHSLCLGVTTETLHALRVGAMRHQSCVVVSPVSLPRFLTVDAAFPRGSIPLLTMIQILPRLGSKLLTRIGKYTEATTPVGGSDASEIGRKKSLDFEHPLGLARIPSKEMQISAPIRHGCQENTTYKISPVFPLVNKIICKTGAQINAISLHSNPGDRDPGSKARRHW